MNKIEKMQFCDVLLTKKSISSMYLHSLQHWFDYAWISNENFDGKIEHKGYFMTIFLLALSIYYLILKHIPWL